MCPSDSERLAELRVLIKAVNASLRVERDNWGNQTDTEHYLVPRGLWNTLHSTSTAEAKS